MDATDFYCLTCRFVSKCNTFKYFMDAIEEIESEVFDRIGADLTLEPKLMYCPKYVPDGMFTNLE